MTAEKWRQISAIYNAAIARGGADRTAYVSSACGADDDLRREVELLLAQGESFLTSPVTLPPGSCIGAYELLEIIGAGGMGIVYRARDQKLQRDVALKVLPEAVALNPDRIARFHREAMVLASLNHPNIGAIYGFEDSGDVHALVLELVDGPTLADRIAQGPIRLDEALPIARQVAEALEAAHEQGIIHRDLKPANIKLRPDGTVKVLDFGLAKALQPALSDAKTARAASLSPTITSTAVMGGGVLLGTAAYMSPELARGKAVDRRTDIWALGCVLYEMLTGTAAFHGENVSDVIANILHGEPAWTALSDAVPPTIRVYLMRCLQKHPHERVQAIGDVRLALGGAFQPIESMPVGVRSAPALNNRLAWLLVAAVTAVVTVLVTVLLSRHETPSETRPDIVTAPTTDLASFALSPDGRSVVFVTSGDGPSQLRLRSLASTTTEPLAGTENATAPFWSPDSRSIGFFANGTLKRVNVDGGAPQTLAASQGTAGGTWNTDGVILFARSSGPVLRVPAGGGTVAAVTTLGRQSSHRFPSFLPDGLHFVFLAQGQTSETTGLYLGSLDSHEIQRLTPDPSTGAYLSPGWLLWVRDGTLVARRLDLKRKVLIGDPVLVADPVLVDPISEHSALSVSATGVVAYRAGGTIRRQLTWFDRSGKALGTVGSADQFGFMNPHVSPDGRRVVGSRAVQGNWDIWLLDGVRTTRFTSDAATEQFPMWSPDGSQIVFQSDRDGVRSIYQRASRGAGAGDALVTMAQMTVPTDWSLDGRFLLYYTIDPQTARDLWVLPVGGVKVPRVFLKTRFDERWGQFSPDGRWVAYMSDESGRDEIYVRPFAASAESGAAIETTGERQVSTEGGLFPRWRADGRELYYIGSEGKLMATPMTITGHTLEPGAPVELFRTRIVGGGVDKTNGPQYDVNREGHFLINTDLNQATTTPITLIQNWQPPPEK